MTERRRSVQWAAQFLAAAELERAGYDVAFTMGNSTPVADLMVGNPVTGEQFWVDVKGLQSRNAWFGKRKGARPNLYYALVFVGSDRSKDMFFVLTQAEFNDLVQKYDRDHPGQIKQGGFAWGAPLGFENKWAKLPGWQPKSN